MSFNFSSSKNIIHEHPHLRPLQIKASPRKLKAIQKVATWLAFFFFFLNTASHLNKHKFTNYTRSTDALTKQQQRELQAYVIIDLIIWTS